MAQVSLAIKLFPWVPTSIPCPRVLLRPQESYVVRTKADVTDNVVRSKLGLLDFLQLKGRVFGIKDVDWRCILHISSSFLEFLDKIAG